MQQARGSSGMLCHWTAVQMKKHRKTHKHTHTHTYVFNSDSTKEFYLEKCDNMYSKKLCIHTYIHTYIQFNIIYMRWRSRLRHCATSRKVTGSIPDYGIGIFH
jgi:hypothetical protein